MPERRFSEEEARRVFAAVAERQGSARPDEPGLSLAEMQEAAEASGLDPALVAAVVAEMSAGDGDEIPTFMGAPLAVRHTRVLPVEVDDTSWTRIVTELRRAFDTPGMPTEMGRQREWTSSTGVNGTPIHLTLVPSAEGSVVALEQTIAKQSKGAGWILPLSVIPTAVLATLVYFTGNLDRVLDRIEIAARDSARASGDLAAPEAPRLDLGALPDAPEASGDSRTRTSTRS